MTSSDELDPTTDDRLRELIRTGPAEEPPWSPDTDAILAQGRRAVRRRRLTTVLAGSLGVAVVATGAYALPSALGTAETSSGYADVALAPTVSAAPEPTAPEPTAPAVPSAEPGPDNGWQVAVRPLGKDAILDRCGEQLRAAHPDIAMDEWRIYGVDDHEDVAYSLGDQVELVAGDIGEVCTLLGGWRAEPAVDFDQPAPPPGDHEAILRACSATIGVDLRSWEVRTAMADGIGGTVAVLTSPEEDPHVGTCTLEPSTWDLGMGPSVRIPRAPASEMLEASAGDPVSWRVGVDRVHTCIKSVVQCHGTVYSGGGMVDPEVASLEFALPGDQVVTVPVENGYFAFRAVDGVEGDGLVDITASAYDEHGELIERFTP